VLVSIAVTISKNMRQAKILHAKAEKLSSYNQQGKAIGKEKASFTFHSLSTVL
jgi:hypothetical protein